MKKPLLVWLLSGSLLISAVSGCTSEKESPEASNAKGLSGQNEENLSKKDVEEDPFYASKPQRENASSPTPSGQEAEKIRRELLMSSKQIKLPAQFLNKQARHVQGSVASNNANAYSIQYHTNTGKPLAHVTAAQYMDIQKAAEEIQGFREGKIVDPSVEGVKPLQHGLPGHVQEGADQYRYSWNKDQWLLSLSSSSLGNSDYTAGIRQITEYLKHHPLPASAEQGVVDIYYAPSSDDVTVDIRWQEGKMVYAVRANLPPAEVVEITASMK